MDSREIRRMKPELSRSLNRFADCFGGTGWVSFAFIHSACVVTGFRHSLKCCMTT